MRATFAALATASLLLAATSVPAFSADNGTVNASVTAATPCITLNIPALDFGTLPFRTSAAGGASKELLNVGSFTNCSVQRENILLRGTNASGAGGAAWTLAGDGGATCNVNEFGSLLGFPGNINYNVSTTDRLIDTPDADVTTVVDKVRLYMPCTGSSGAGQTMSWQYIFTATF